MQNFYSIIEPIFIILRLLLYMPNELQHNQLVQADTDDYVLLQLISEGNEEAFSVLYQRHSPILLRYATHFLNGDVSLAADIVDDAMFQIWKSAATFKAKSKPSTWMYSITRNKLVDYLRKNSDSRLDKDLLYRSMEKLAPSAETMLVQASIGQELFHFMEKLSAEHKEVLRLAYFQELSIKEIAAMLKISENTVKTRMFYARQKMKKILQSAGILNNEYETD